MKYVPCMCARRRAQSAAREIRVTYICMYILSGVVIAFWGAAVGLLGAVLYKKARAARGDCASATVCKIVLQ